jgi:hypothetical protein
MAIYTCCKALGSGEQRKEAFTQYIFRVEATICTLWKGKIERWFKAILAFTNEREQKVQLCTDSLMCKIVGF